MAFQQPVPDSELYQGGMSIGPLRSWEIKQYEDMGFTDAEISRLNDRRTSGEIGATASAASPENSYMKVGHPEGGYGPGQQFNYLTGNYEYGIPKQHQTVNIGTGTTTISDDATGEHLATGHYSSDGGGLNAIDDYVDPQWQILQENTAERLRQEAAAPPPTSGGSFTPPTEYPSGDDSGSAFGNQPGDLTFGGGVGDTYQGFLNPDGTKNTSWDWSGGGQGGTTGIDPGYGQGGQMPGNQPGYLSPWGGNKEFYHNQFMGLLQDDQEFQRQQSVAEAIRAQAKENPLENQWDWSNTSLPNIVGGPESSDARTLGSQYEGMTNAQVINQIGGQFGQEQGQWYQDLLGDQGNDWGAGTELAGAGYDANMTNTANSDLSGNAKNYMNDLYNTIYPMGPGNIGQTPGGMTVPAGYASPINA